MREILFRAKAIKTNEWVYGDLVHNTLTISISNPSPFQAGARRFTKVKPKTVGQFTGKCDRNQNKIFEGDILSCASIEDFYVIEFMDGAFVAVLDDNVIYDLEEVVDGLEIVGNIYDNKNTED